jgi:hypothetical protein
MADVWPCRSKQAKNVRVCKHRWIRTKRRNAGLLTKTNMQFLGFTSSTLDIDLLAALFPSLLSFAEAD